MMGLERQRKFIAELAPREDKHHKLVEVRFLDNSARSFGTAKPLIVWILHIVYWAPDSRITAGHIEGWSVSARAIDKYAGGGAHYDTLEQARKVFDQYVARSGAEASLF